MDIVIIDYGAGNVRSVQFALERLRVQARTSSDPDTIRKADRVIFPGVGEAATAMRTLKEKGIAELIPQLQQPVLGICLGMQLLCRYSEEGDTEGMNIFPVDVLRFSHQKKVPHMGWNVINFNRQGLFQHLDKPCYVYFVHSYYVPLCDYTIADSDYALPFSAALRKDNFYVCQFHPEKSSDAGLRILQNFLTVS